MPGFYKELDKPSDPEGQEGEGMLLIDDDLDGEGALEK